MSEHTEPAPTAEPFVAHAEGWCHYDDPSIGCDDPYHPWAERNVILGEGAPPTRAIHPAD